MEHFNLQDRLHTDVLEKKYGKISSKVIEHNNKLRISHLIDKKNISRTYAITFFDYRLSSKLKKINKEIQKGNPIGKEFRKQGYKIRKNVVDVFLVKLSKNLQKRFKTKQKLAKTRLSEFYTSKNGENPEIYGIVAEIYSPNFRFPKINSIDLAQINPLTKIFKKIGISKEKIWKRLGEDNNWKKLNKEHLKAKETSQTKIKAYHKKIEKLIKLPKYS